MLNRLIIKNIALIHELEIDLAAGMNVLSGETGAGKSIIVDSVNLVLGERADRELIRTGTSRAVVEAWFGDVKQSVNDMLAAQEIEPGPELVLSRELSASGKNVCRINGTLVTLGMLKDISDRLVDIHGQHEHQSLLDEKNHIALLDDFDGSIADAKAAVETLYGEYTVAQGRLKSFCGSEGERERRIDILKYQINEIRQANISDGEEQDLLAQKKRMNAAEKIMDALGAAYASLYQRDQDNVLALLKDVSSRFKSIADVDGQYEDIAGRVDEAYFALEEIASGIRDEISECSFDADSLEEVEERLALIHSLARKYQDPRVTGTFIRNAEQELGDLIDSEAAVQALTEKISRLKTALYEKSVQLSGQRRQAAQVFEHRVRQQLSDLGMPSASFSVHFEPLADAGGCVFTKNGIDTAAFYISTNRGEPEKPLKKVASGGEVSRIMLALKNIAADKGGIPTMIFDEIDTGISGRMAQIVAEKLQRIAKGRQVICVTHLPQIASMADKHFLVTKQSDQHTTRTCLTPLSGQDRVAEIARLAGGDSGAAALHAKEMLARADAFKAT